MHDSKPLYRKVTRTHHLHHGGGDYRWTRNGKREKNGDLAFGSMHAGQRHGFDYTPLFKFLISKIGQDWDAVYSAAVARLDRPDPIFWLVARTGDKKRELVPVGESSYFSGLYITEDNRLAKVNPDLRVEDLKPFCSCCTHTFHGAPYVNKYAPVAALTS